MYILKLKNVFGDTLYYSTMDSLAKAHEEALENGWAGATVTIAEGIPEADGQLTDLELLYEYVLDQSDYSASPERTGAPYRGPPSSW
jgi:hypothetical protein